MGHDIGPILVTGASGYLGGRIVAELSRIGVSSVPLSRQGMAGYPPCDMTDPDALSAFICNHNTQSVIHCAAKVPSSGDDYTDESAATESLKIVENLIAAEPRHIVFTSSMTVYPADIKIPVSENDATPPSSGYGGGKRRAEIAFFEKYKGVASILRLPELFGPPRAGGLLHNVAHALAMGAQPQLPADPPVWAALHVDDAADLCVRAALRRPDHSIILNVGYQGAFSTMAAVNTLAKLFNQPNCTQTAAPEFEMNLQRLEAELGLPCHTFWERLSELAEGMKRKCAGKTD